MEEHPQARFIVETLGKAGYVAYYAGGWVRDFLLQHPSDDIDIATNAPPETVRALFAHTIPIGITFGIVLVIIDGHQYEVATFRKDFDYEDGRRPSKIVFSTAEEDAKRRDFTINGMFYDPIHQKILDYVNGQADLKKGVIRAIGNPHERIKEDRLRMIRAVRLSCRFDFPIEESTEEAIRFHAQELFPAVAIERIYQELEKSHRSGKLRPVLIKLHELSLLSVIFPSLEKYSVPQIKTILLPTKNYPLEAPLISFLLALFPDASLQNVFALCKNLKISNVDQQFAAFLFHAKQFLEESKATTIPLVQWAYFYANAFAKISLQILNAHLDPAQQNTFLQEHKQKMNKLSSSIARIQNHCPVVKSSDLLKEGIVPGKLMGQLLKQAECISINEQIDDPKLVIEILKKLKFWPNIQNG